MADDYTLEPVEHDPFGGTNPFADTGMAQFRKAQGLSPVTTMPPSAPVDVVGHVAQTMVRGVGDMLATPGRAYREGLSPEEEVNWGGGMAMGMMGMGAPFAPKGAAGIFGGKLAATADRAALARAEEMASQGIPREHIWNETGWFQGADDKWRFEIPDDKSVFRGLNPEPQSTPARVALQHPDLFAAYPDLVGTRINETTNSIGSLERGRWRSGLGVDNPDIDLSWSAPDKHSTLLHELQHGVQEAEGFGRGTNTIALRPNTVAWDLYQERIKAIRDSGRISREEFSKRAGYDGLAPEKDYKDFVKQTRKISPSIDRAAQEYAVQEAYRRHAGEVEARNVQKRMNMTPEELRAKPPWTTEDVPREQQIVRMRDGTSLRLDPVDHDPFAPSKARGGRISQRKAKVAAILRKYGVAA